MNQNASCSRTGRAVRHNREISTLGIAIALWMAGVAMGAETPLTGDRIPTEHGAFVVHPVNHATVVLQSRDTVIYVDPVGGGRRFEGLPRPDVILVTDIHGDHLNADTLSAVAQESTRIIAPKAVVEKLPDGLSKKAVTLANGEKRTVAGIEVEAIPMYNLTPERMRFHDKGRGNGYVVTLDGKRVYFSGDTEDIPEMRALKDIDVAFVCMNLPYTMDVEHAADAVRAFRPKVVYPYHFRGSDVNHFKELAEKGTDVEVRLRDWY